MAYAAVISLMSALDNLLLSRISFSPFSKTLLLTLGKELNLLKNVLERLDATSKGSSRKNVNALDAEIKDEVWRIQDLVESHVYDHILDPEVSLQELRFDVDGFVEMINEKKVEYFYELDYYMKLPPEEEEEVEQPPLDTDSGERETDFKMVGDAFDMLMEVIRTRMEFSRSPIDVVPVVGMAGIGKTAVAREFFDKPLLLSELGIECRAWVSVGRKPRMIRIIKRDILNQLDPTASGRDGQIRERDVDHRLKRIFKAKRCLVVLDDVWDTLVWYELRYLFPDYGRGKNLVMLTSRLRHVGDEIDHSWSRRRCDVKFLDRDQSWHLLRQRVFKEEEECPPQFIKAGQKIAEKCDGLPLMILAVAALLLEAEMTVEFWEEVAEKANHLIFTAAYDQLYEVLLPSYEYLPQHLKPCFLHMGVFPQYAEIRRTKLYWLWESEGFLDPAMKDPLDAYLNELLDHTVIILCRFRSFYTNDIKTCRLHSTFWYLCRREATTTKFCHALSSRHDGLQQLTIKGQRRLSFHNNILLAMKDVLDTVEEACASSARSFLCYGPYHPYMVPICSGLRLLKLLDVLRIRFYEFPEQVMQLAYLRFLALACNSVLPPIISRLWGLQFLIIYEHDVIRFCGETHYVAVEIWNMKRLERIEIDGQDLPNPPPRDDDGASSLSLERLKTLTGVSAETCTREVLERILNLTKLGILIGSSPNDDEMEQVLDNLSNIHLLSKLLSLKCVITNPVLVKGKDVVAPMSMFSPTLTKLFLSGMGYAWECMSIIGSLPKLQVLKLRSYAFRGPEWVVRYGEFRALRYLMIEGTDLEHFEVEDRGWVSLRAFKLYSCYKLKHLLWEIDLAYPVSIGVFDCSPAAATFANEMRSRYESHSQSGQRLVEVHSSWE